MSIEKQDLSLIEPANELPGKKNYKEKRYDKIISEFIESGLTLAKVRPIPGKHPRSMYASLRKRLLESDTSAIAILRGDDIYLKIRASKLQHGHEHDET